LGGPAVGLLLAGLGLLGTCCVLAMPETRDRAWDAMAPEARFRG
jgi:hypothetical protein